MQGEHEIDYVLFIQVPQDSITIKPDPDEVDAVEWVSKKQLSDLLLSKEKGIEVGNIEANALWSPWFRLIAYKWVLPVWWDNLNSLEQCVDKKEIYRFDPPLEHMGGGGNAGTGEEQATEGPAGAEEGHRK